MKIARAFGMATGLAALAVTMSPSAFAGDTGWYTGFNAGQSRAKIDDTRIADGLLDDGFTTTSISNDDRHFGFKAFGGYEFNRYFALESGYFNLGKFGFTADTSPAGSLRGDIKLQGANFDAVGSVPLGDKFSLFARVGVNYADAKDAFAGTGAVAVIDRSPAKWAANYKFGFGAEYDFTRFIGMRIEAERYRIDDAVVSPDRLALRWEARGTHQGEYLGVQASGRPVSYTGITLYELRDGRIARVWVSADLLSLLRRLNEERRATAEVRV